MATYSGKEPLADLKKHQPDSAVTADSEKLNESLRKDASTSIAGGIKVGNAKDSKELEANNTLPHVTLDAEKAAPVVPKVAYSKDRVEENRTKGGLAEKGPNEKGPNEKGPANQDRSQKNPIQKDWTVAIELATTLQGTNDHPGFYGADLQLRKLKQLQQETAGKSVGFMVHAELPTDPSGKPCGDKSTEQAGTCISGALKTNHATTQRYFVHDGQIEKLPDANYKSGSESITALLKEANKLAPSDKLGLIVQSHGIGYHGIATNLGEVSLESAVQSIQSGLKGSAHKKLDLLDYDACSMADVKVLAESAKVANDVVASAAVEGSGKTTDAQSLDAAMRSALADSSMTGKQLGEKIVGQAKDGLDGQGDDAAISTLSNFDLRKFDDFKKNLSDFGTALGAAGKVGRNKQILAAAIDESVVPDDGNSSEPSHERDLKSFANCVLNAIAQGKLTGDTKPLQSSAHAFLNSLDKMATAQYGASQFGYDNTAGLTASMPGSELSNIKEAGNNLSPIHEISDRLLKGVTGDLEFKDKELFMQQFDLPMERLHFGWAKEHPGELKRLDEAITTIKKAPDLKSMLDGMTQLQLLSAKYDGGPVGEWTRKAMTERAKIELESYLFVTPKIAPGWDSFMQSLVKPSK